MQKGPSTRHLDIQLDPFALHLTNSLRCEMIRLFYPKENTGWTIAFHLLCSEIPLTQRAGRPQDMTLLGMVNRKI